MDKGTVLIVGGTGGLGQDLASYYAAAGHQVVITGRDAETANAKAGEVGATVSGVGFDLAEPETIAPALADIGPVARLVLTAIARDNNPIRDYNYETARYLATMKLVGYSEVIHSLISRMNDDSSVVLFGGRAKDRPYPGSTTVTAVNGGVSSMIRTFAIELAPIRFNAIHPGIVGDTPFWEGKDLDAVVKRTPTGRLVTSADVVAATVFLLENRSVNGINLYVDGGWMLM